MSTDRATRYGALFDHFVALVGRDHAITYVLLLHRFIVRTLDTARGIRWRTRADGAIAFIPTDEHIEHLFDAAIDAVGAERAAALMALLDWRAARALDRRRPGWRDVTSSPYRPSTSPFVATTTTRRAPW
jgi:hypothetical protein